MQLKVGEVWHFIRHLSRVVAALLQIFALPPIAELLALLSPPLFGPSLLGPEELDHHLCVLPEGVEVGTSPDSHSKSPLGVMKL